MIAPTPPPAPATCPSCGAAAEGRFCSSCGTALAGAACNSCDAPLTPGSRFCHRCGTPAGAAAPRGSRGFGAILPWTVAALALASIIALVVGQRFGARPDPANDVAEGSNAQPSAPFANPNAPAGAMPRAPDISSMTPSQRAERLYDRIMTESEAGRTQNVRTFMPMAIAAYDMLGTLTTDQRYDLARLGEVSGDTALARAQVDTLLAARPTHLLALGLGARLARDAGDVARARTLDARLLAAEPAEQKAALPEYLLHRNDVAAMVAAARAR